MEEETKQQIMQIAVFFIIVLIASTIANLVFPGQVGIKTDVQQITTLGTPEMIIDQIKNWNNEHQEETKIYIDECSYAERTGTNTFNITLGEC